MKKMIMFFILIHVGMLNAEIIINEILPAPLSPEPEWIELYNYSDHTISYDTLYIQDATTAKPFISISLAPKQFAIVTKDTNALKAKRNIPSGAKLIYCKLPALNNTTDHITLRNSNFATIDSFYFDLKLGKKGISFERVIPIIPANAPNNFATCIAKDSATCGMKNSISPADKDLAITHFAQSNDKLIAIVKNIGTFEIPNSKINITSKLPDENINKEFNIYPIQSIKANDSVQIEIPISQIQSALNIAGTIQAIASLEINDEKTENNSANTQIYLQIPPNAIKFNEICYDADDNFAEFVELYNNSTQAIYLNHLLFLNYSDTKIDTTILEMPEFKIASNSFALFAADSMIYNSDHRLSSNYNIYLFQKRNLFNNTADKIAIADPMGNLLDGMEYDYHQQNSELFPLKNRSLEKISPELKSRNSENWKSCLDILLSTPLRANNTILPPNSELEITISANPYRKNVDKSCLLNIKSEYSSAYYSIKVIDMEGNCVSTIRNLGVIGVNAEFDIAEYLSALKVGAYILKVEMTDTASGKYDSQLKLFAVGED